MKTLFSFFLLTLWINIQAQVAINTDGSAPDNSAMLDIKSTTGGLLIPRMTALQRNAITLPVAGLMVFVTDNSSFYFYDGTSWNLIGPAVPANIAGTTNYIVKFTGINSGGNSQIYDNATNVGINTITPAGKLNIKGSADVSQLVIDAFGTQSNTNPFIKLRSSSGSDLMWLHSDNPTNTFVGLYTGRVNDAGGGGTGNTFISRDAGYSNTTGSDNTSIGYTTLHANTLGNSNTAVGSGAMYSNTKLGRNTAIGRNALYSQSYSLEGPGWNTDNVAIGCEALYSNQPTSMLDGQYNTAIGSFSLHSNTTGSDNVAVGHSALYFSTNNLGCTAIGALSLYYNTGSSNTAVGYRSLYYNTTGLANTAVGETSLFANQTGEFNTAIGKSSLASNTTGSYNTAEGRGALLNNSIGNHNTANGYRSLYSNDDGNYNTAAGSESLSFSTSGDNNTAYGYSALFSNVAGSNATAVGYNAMQFANNSAAAFTNYNLAFGYEALRGSANASANTGNHNSALGYQTLRSNTTGNSNTAIGYQSLYSNTTGYSNTASGYQSLFSNTTGYGNSALGLFSLYLNTTGDNNTANGVSAMYSNTTGYSNTACGNSALYSNTAGIGNSSMGSVSLYSNTTGSYNTAGGFQSLHDNTTGSSNTASGYVSLNNNTTGSNNTALGRSSMYSNTTANQNIAIGRSALYSQSYNNGNVTWNSDNVAIGYEALSSNQPTSTFNGIANTATGNYALSSNSTGYNNTANGYYTLYSNTNGYYNTATGNFSLRSNITGDRNTALGAYSSYYTDSDNNTCIGYQAGDIETFSTGTFLGALAYPGTSGISNCMALGYNARVSASNRVVIGNTSVTSIGGYADWTTFSDGRYKRNINEEVPGLAFINQLRPVTYHLDVTSLNTALDKNKPTTLRKGELAIEETPEERAGIEAKEKIVYTGFIAQEVEAAAKAIGFNFSGVDTPENENDYYGLRYSEFVVPLVKAVQEQQSMIEEQKILIEDQLKMIVELQNANAGLLLRVEKLEKNK